MSAKLIFFAGSASKNSIHKKLAHAGADIARDIGAEVTILDLKDYELPLYCTDLEMEQGIPENVIKLKELFVAHDGFFVASPEYNSTFTPLMKNTFDWMSRPHYDGEPMFEPFDGKVAAITAASPGALGGIRGLFPLRLWLSNMNIHVIPKQMAMGNASNGFNDDGTLSDERQSAMLTDVVKQLVETATKLKA